MELWNVVQSVKALSMSIDEKGVIRPEGRKDLWLAVLDGTLLRLANPLRRTGITELEIEDIIHLGTLESQCTLTIETEDGWDICNCESNQLRDPYERVCQDEIDLDDGEDLVPWEDIGIDPKKGPTTLREYDIVFRNLFAGLREAIYYDELKESVVVDMSVFGRPDLGEVPLDDVCSKIYHLAVEKEMFEQFAWTNKVSTTTMDDEIAIFASERRRNPFLEWVQGLQWDGTPRVATLFRDLFGATAPALTGEEGEKYLAQVALSWLTGAISRTQKATKHEIVPVFISNQGMGKGSALSLLAGNDDWFIDTTDSPVDDVKVFLENVSGRIIVELSESTQLKKDVDKVKGFISKKEDQYRKPYARFTSTNPRRFILAASSNDSSVFVDVTGNRRFYPMYCDSYRCSIAYSIDRRIGQDYVEQVWAETYQLWKEGKAVPFVDDDIDFLAERMQDYATVENGHIIAIDQYLDDPMNGLDHVGARISRAFIMDRVFGYSGVLVPHDLEKAYKDWTKGTKSWRRVPFTIRVDGKACSGYERICEPGKIPPRPKLYQVRELPKPLLEAFKAFIEGKKIGDALAFDRFVAMGISRSDAIDQLLSKGLIYETRENGAKVFKTAVSTEDLDA